MTGKEIRDEMETLEDQGYTGMYMFSVEAYIRGWTGGSDFAFKQDAIAEGKRVGLDFRKVRVKRRPSDNNRHRGLVVWEMRDGKVIRE